MRSRSLGHTFLQVLPRHITINTKWLTCFALACCLTCNPAAMQNQIWAQPLGPPEEVEGGPPAIVNFTTSHYPGSGNWIISGRIIGCEDPDGIEVSIGGAVDAGAVTDVLGYFDVVVYYTGFQDTITADADYEGDLIPQAQTQIGE